jgi:hypothetical protein
MSNARVLFPINQREQAAHGSAEVLLAVDVYQKLMRTVREALQLVQDAKKQDHHSDDVNHHRAHTAVLIDGSRGTGKSSVLVNIGRFLEEHDPELAQRVHILRPLDPTLLETNDDLFLNVIVAGLVCDGAVQAARARNQEKADLFHEQLQRLGNTLDRLESQRELRGLDKLRAFMGNQNLAQEVHQVFKIALDLLGKELLVLPIDDVDTSLNRAFDNLEVIRKYLVSPYVLPVISGDLDLYGDLTWRNFHDKLLQTSKVENQAAIDRAKDLAREYQRKVLPLQYRIEMPEVGRYLRATTIGFCDANREAIPAITMQHFHGWLETLLNERTNGLENSYLPAPIKNVRSLAQLVYSVQDQIPRLAAIIAAEGLSPAQLRRQTVIPVKAAAIQSFEQAYSAASRIVDKSANEAARHDAYKNFVTGAEAAPEYDRLRELALESQVLLKEYCQLAVEGGPAYLTLTAQEQWLNEHVVPNLEDGGVLDSLLFQPMRHRDDALRHFAPGASTEAWRETLLDRAPADWLARLPAETLLPYPAPEPGYALKKGNARFGNPESDFIAALLLHRNFYTASKQATLACCGRIFELIVTSFIKDVTSADVADILQRSPFHSLAAVAATKTHTVATDDDSEQLDEPAAETEADDVPLHGSQIEQLAVRINAWRATHGLAGHVPSPWFFYNVMNKVFNQAAIFNAPQARSSNPDSKALDYLARLAPKVFNSIWAAIGSFEKGPLFGLPPIIAQVNVGEGKVFRSSELYTRNIAPFVGARTEADAFGRTTRAYTYMMADHPLRELVLALDTPAPAANGPSAPPDAAAPPKPPRKAPRNQRETRSPLLEYLNTRLGTRYTIFRRTWIADRLMALENWEQIADEVLAKFPHDRYRAPFLDVVNRIAKERS